MATKSLWDLVKAQFSDKLVQILLGVAVLSTVFSYLEGDVHALTEPVVIATILLVNALVGVYHR